MPADLRTSSRRAIRRRVRDATFAVVTAFVIPAVVFIGVGAVRADAVETERRCGVARTVAAQAAADAHEAMTAADLALAAVQGLGTDGASEVPVVTPASSGAVPRTAPVGAADVADARRTLAALAIPKQCDDREDAADIVGAAGAAGAVSSAAAVLDRRVQDLTRHVARLLEEHTAHSAAG